MKPRLLPLSGASPETDTCTMRVLAMQYVGGCSLKLQVYDLSDQRNYEWRGTCPGSGRRGGGRGNICPIESLPAPHIAVSLGTSQLRMHFSAAPVFCNGELGDALCMSLVAVISLCSPVKLPLGYVRLCFVCAFMEVLSVEHMLFLKRTAGRIDTRLNLGKMLALADILPA